MIEHSRVGNGAPTVAADGDRVTGVALWARRLTRAPLFFATVAAVGLALGMMLTPDPRGLGTHEALGLPPCAFRYVTGLPCPGCGMTTAVTHAAHGHFIRSFLTQPAGFVLGVALWCTVPIMVYAGWRRLPVAAVVPRAPRHPWGWGVVAIPLLLVAWAYKLMVVGFFS